jgi:hypothetical protein
MESKYVKPKCKLIGKDGNIFNLMAIARRTLIKDGQRDKSNEMIEKVKTQNSYDEALAVIMEFVDVY